MKIAICDENKSLCKQLEGWVDWYFRKENIRIELDTFFCLEQFLQCLSEKNYFDIIFLDIESPQKKEQDIAKKLRSCVEEGGGLIDFISSRQELEMPLFDLQPINFRIKPLKQEQIELDLNKACYILREKRTELSYFVNDVKKTVLLKDICYLESTDGRICAHTLAGERIALNGTLEGIEKKYDSHALVQCHKFFIVNLYYVCRYKNRALTLQDGTMLPVGEEYVTRFKNRLHELDYLGE